MDADSIAELTMSLMEFKTTSSNLDEINRCMDTVEEFFSDDVFHVERFESGGKSSLVVSFDGSKTPEVLLHGHIDVVPADDELFEPRVEDGRIYGRGSADMKGGVACLMHVMKELGEMDSPPSVALMVVPDEEIGGMDGARYLVEDEGYRPSFVVTAEPGIVSESGEGLDVFYRHKGLLWVTAVADGKNAHGSRPWNGENAIERLMEAYTELKQAFPEPVEGWNSTVSVNFITGGDTHNTIPDSAEMKLDIRCTEELPNEEVLEKLNGFDGIRLKEIPPQDNLPPVENDPDNPYIQRLKESAEAVTDKESSLRSRHGSSDLPHFARHGISGVEMGPRGDNIHEDGEYVEIQSLMDYAETILEFTRN